jgi:hypothetical protein
MAILSPGDDGTLSHILVSQTEVLSRTQEVLCECLWNWNGPARAHSNCPHLCGADWQSTCKALGALQVTSTGPLHVLLDWCSLGTSTFPSQSLCSPSSSCGFGAHRAPQSDLVSCLPTNQSNTNDATGASHVHREYFDQIHLCHSLPMPLFSLSCKSLKWASL